MWNTPLALAALCAGLSPSVQEPTQLDPTPTEAARFGDPVRLMVGKTALGAELKYPSPRVFDVDGDGAAELILGDLTGKVHVSRRVDPADPTAWGPLEPLTTGDRPLVFHNW